MVSEWRAILSKKEGIPDHSLPAIKILSYALNVFEEHKCIKYLFPIANAIYVIARSVYMTGKGAEITDLLRRLIPVMEEEILTAQDIEMDNITLAIKVADIYIYYLMKSREYEVGKNKMCTT